MAIERAVLPERVRVNILSSEGARATLCGARTSELYQAPRGTFRLRARLRLAYPANRPRCAKRLAKPSPSWSYVTQQAGSQAKQTASSLAADANQKAKGFCRQASSRQLNVRRASARTSMPNTMPESPHIPDLRRGSGTACV
jgi:hypothetical protein